MPITWKRGMSYCGTAMEAINFALDLSLRDDAEAIVFLNDWREGDLTEWPEFEFEPHPSAALPK